MIRAASSWIAVEGETLSHAIRQRQTQKSDNRDQDHIDGDYCVRVALDAGEILRDFGAMLCAAIHTQLGVPMKSCPACNRTFDDTLTFCLIDGQFSHHRLVRILRVILSSPKTPDTSGRAKAAECIWTL